MENDLIRRSDAENIFRNARKHLKPENYSGQEFFIRDNILLNAEQVVHSIPAVDAVAVSGATRRAVELIVEERRRQIAEWGDQSVIPLFEFMSILGEEYGELCQAVNETLFVNPKHPERGGIDAIRREAVQVAAVAAQIIEACMDGRREDGDA